MKTTIFRYSSQDTNRVIGCHPTYGLDKHDQYWDYGDGSPEYVADLVRQEED